MSELNIYKLENEVLTVFDSVKLDEITESNIDECIEKLMKALE